MQAGPPNSTSRRGRVRAKKCLIRSRGRGDAYMAKTIGSLRKPGVCLQLFILLSFIMLLVLHQSNLFLTCMPSLCVRNAFLNKPYTSYLGTQTKIRTSILGLCGPLLATSPHLAFYFSFVLCYFVFLWCTRKMNHLMQPLIRKP